MDIVYVASSSATINTMKLLDPIRAMSRYVDLLEDMSNDVYCRVWRRPLALTLVSLRDGHFLVGARCGTSLPTECTQLVQQAIRLLVNPLACSMQVFRTIPASL